MAYFVVYFTETFSLGNIKYSSNLVAIRGFGVAQRRIIIWTGNQTFQIVSF